MRAGTVATTFLPCRILSSTFGPVAVPLDRVFAGADLLAVYGYGIAHLQSTLVGSEHACRQQQSQSQQQALGDFRCVHCAPFFFPETSGTGSGGLDLPGAGNSCVLPSKAYNAASGLSKEGWAARLRAFCSGIVLTWAAKPSVRPIPLTPEIVLFKTAGQLLVVSSDPSFIAITARYVDTSLKSSAANCDFVCTSFDDLLAGRC